MSETASPTPETLAAAARLLQPKPEPFFVKSMADPLEVLCHELGLPAVCAMRLLNLGLT